MRASTPSTLRHAGAQGGGEPLGGSQGGSEPAAPVDRRYGPSTYSRAHLRVRAARGPASDHPCAACGGPAEDWCYSGPTPPPFTDPRGRAYSLDPRQYVARCRPCHAIADRPAYCRRGHPFTPENTYVRPGRGTRQCRACRRARDTPPPFDLGAWLGGLIADDLATLALLEGVSQ